MPLKDGPKAKIRTQKVIVPQGIINPNKETVIEIPPDLYGKSLVVAKKVHTDDDQEENIRFVQPVCPAFTNPNRTKRYEPTSYQQKMSDEVNYAYSSQQPATTLEETERKEREMILRQLEEYQNARRRFLTDAANMATAMASVSQQNFGGCTPNQIPSNMNQLPPGFVQQSCAQYAQNPNQSPYHLNQSQFSAYQQQYNQPSVNPNLSVYAPSQYSEATSKSYSSGKPSTVPATSAWLRVEPRYLSTEEVVFDNVEETFISGKSGRSNDTSYSKKTGKSSLGERSKPNSRASKKNAKGELPSDSDSSASDDSDALNCGFMDTSHSTSLNKDYSKRNFEKPPCSNKSSRVTVDEYIMNDKCSRHQRSQHHAELEELQRKFEEARRQLNNAVAMITKSISNTSSICPAALLAANESRTKREPKCSYERLTCPALPRPKKVPCDADDDALPSPGVCKARSTSACAAPKRGPGRSASEKL